MSISNGKLEVVKWISPWYIQQLDADQKAEYDLHIAQWDGSPDPWPAFASNYNLEESKAACVQVIIDNWDNFEDVFTFPTIPIFRIGHPLKRLAAELEFTLPDEFIKIEYLVLPQNVKINPKNGALVLGASLNASGQCSYENTVALGTKHIKLTDGRIFNSIPGDYITTMDHFQLAFQDYPTAPGQDLSN